MAPGGCGVRPTTTGPPRDVHPPAAGCWCSWPDRTAHGPTKSATSAQRERAVDDVDRDRVALADTAFEDGGGPSVSDLPLDHPLQRTSAEGRVEAFAGQQRAGVVGDLEHDALAGEAILEVAELQVHDVAQVGLRQRAEADDVVDPVDELGLEEPERM